MSKKTTLGREIGRPRRTTLASRTTERNLLLNDRVDPEDELNKAFDPMQDMHLWTMWRSAVTGIIVDETKSFEDDDFKQYPLGKSIVQIPLKRLIKLETDSGKVAQGFMNPFRNGSSESAGSRRHSMNPSSSQGSTPRKGTLGTGQFVFYGVPRAVLKKE